MRVYGRSDRPGRIFLSCAWRKTPAGGVRQEALPEGKDRESAELVAQEVALARERVILSGEIDAPAQGPITLGRLLAKYHASAKAERWSPSHRREQNRLRHYWLKVFGADRPMASITPEEVENAARETARTRDWSASSEAKALKYLKAASRYGQRKARVLDDDSLTAVDLPQVEPDTAGLDYTETEVAQLTTLREDIDWRVTLACSIAADVGRRIGAIRRLRIEEVAVGPGRVWLTFRKDTDKGRRSSAVPLSEHTAELVLRALTRPEVQSSGWLFPREGLRAEGVG